MTAFAESAELELLHREEMLLLDALESSAPDANGTA